MKVRNGIREQPAPGLTWADPEIKEPKPTGLENLRTEEPASPEIMQAAAGEEAVAKRRGWWVGI